MRVLYRSIMVSVMMVFVISVLSTSIAAAAQVNEASRGIAQVLCKIIQIAQGDVGKAIAIIIVLSLSIGLFFGKITWGVAIAVALGMGILFGANAIVGYIAGGANPCIDVDQG